VKNIPRTPNSILIVITTTPIQSSSGTINIVSYYGDGWVVIWYDPKKPMGHTLINKLAHELGHEFGADHSMFPTSVMCSSFNNPACSMDSLMFDRGSVQKIGAAIRIMKRISFETYIGIRATDGPE
jgi:hypothetical protein